ncbi:hypothetical protein [Caproicibacterium sp. XB1]|uniref:hypothetical protein n=1 Tax=Caproicibacterium sp. XB1 TaxID=3396405 RepID=UPI0039B6F589
MPKIYSIDEFANQCGYFYNAYLEKGISANNGYNCRHPKCEEVQNGVGCCFSWGCPLGYEADEEDFANPQIDHNGWTDYEEGKFIIPNAKEDNNA